MNLEGQKIIVTRPSPDADEMIAALVRAGAQVLHAPLIQIQKLELKGDLPNLKEYDAVVFSSKNGARYFFETFQKIPSTLKIAAVGASTASEIKTHGVQVDLVPKQSEGSEELFSEMKRAWKLKRMRILLPRAREGREFLMKGLEREGASVTSLPLYETVPDSEGVQKCLKLLHDGVDWITFASGSAVFALFEGSQVNPEIEEHRTKIAVIGPTTAEALQKYRLAPDADLATLLNYSVRK
jgi:uroporphyrinogen III methyltransferase/synthase